MEGQSLGKSVGATESAPRHTTRKDGVHKITTSKLQPGDTILVHDQGYIVDKPNPVSRTTRDGYVIRADGYVTKWRKVQKIEQAGRGYRVTFEDGSRIGFSPNHSHPIDVTGELSRTPNFPKGSRVSVVDDGHPNIKPYIGKTGTVTQTPDENPFGAHVVTFDDGKVAGLNHIALRAAKRTPRRQDGTPYKEPKVPGRTRIGPNGVEGPAPDEYRMQHHAPAADYGAPLHDLRNMFGDDFYSHPEYHKHGTPGEDESLAIAKRVRNKPDAMVTVYRALPQEHAHRGINPGDWVSTSREYAQTHAASEGWPVISAQVRADQLHSSGDITEYGYNGTDVVGAKVPARRGRGRKA